jgi:DNA (cytosine-5)-methyltransferase 1
VSEVYSCNFDHPTEMRTIESIPDADYHRWAADMWWMSPPCQPYTRRGLQRDMEDPRAAPLLALIDRLPRLHPRHIVLENVPPFESSHACQRLRDTLDRCRYHVQDVRLCPTELGIPNRRQRFYLVASQDPLHPFEKGVLAPRLLSDYLDRDPDPALHLPTAIAQQYASALDVVDASDPHACCSCFTAAYGRSPVRSGSYLETPAGLRRFSPREILRLLGFPDAFRLPTGLTLERAWRCLGNSLSVVAVRQVLRAIPAWGVPSAGTKC